MAKTAAEAAKEWRACNPNAASEYYQAHKEHYAQWRAAHREQLRLANAEYNRRKAEERSTKGLSRRLELIAELGGRCMQCGYDHPAVLHFHHRNPDEKRFDISQRTLCRPRQYPIELIKAEIAKCDLLCANCHIIEHSWWVPVEDES